MNNQDQIELRPEQLGLTAPSAEIAYKRASENEKQIWQSWAELMEQHLQGMMELVAEKDDLNEGRAELIAKIKALLEKSDKISQPDVRDHILAQFPTIDDYELGSSPAADISLKNFAQKEPYQGYKTLDVDKEKEPTEMSTRMKEILKEVLELDKTLFDLTKTKDRAPETSDSMTLGKPPAAQEKND